MGRAIFGSNHWKQMQKGHKAPSIFRIKDDSIEISVFLLGFTSNEMLTNIGDAMAKNRGAGRSFYGWAEVSVVNASENGREVHYTPQPGNKWHADIVLPVIINADKRKREQHFGQLARAAIPRSRE